MSEMGWVPIIAAEDVPAGTPVGFTDDGKIAATTSLTFYRDDPEQRERDWQAALADPNTRVVAMPTRVDEDGTIVPDVKPGDTVTVYRLGDWIQTPPVCDWSMKIEETEES